MYLVLSLGGSTVSVNDQGFGATTTWTDNGFQKIDGVHWTLTERDTDRHWLVGYNWIQDYNSGEFGAWPEDKNATWPQYRCVRTVN